MKGKIPAIASVPLIIFLLLSLTISAGESPVPRNIEKELPSWFAGGSTLETTQTQSAPQPSPQRPTEAQSATPQPTATQPSTPQPTPAQSSPPQPSPTQPTTPQATPTTPSTPKPTPQEALPSEVSIALKEYSLNPNKVTAKAGKVTFVLTNKGKFTHNFHVEGHSIDKTARKFGPGTTLNFEIELPEPGEYKISCPLSNHEQRGMVGTLIVER